MAMALRACESDDVIYGGSRLRGRSEARSCLPTWSSRWDPCPWRCGQPLSFDGVHNFLDTLFGDDLHAKRVKSLARAARGDQSASLAVGLIGRGLALARGRLTGMHRSTRWTRLLSNQGIDVDACCRVGALRDPANATAVTVAMDWTEFDADGQVRIGSLLYSVVPPRTERHAAGLADRGQGDAENRRNGYGDVGLVRLAEILPAGVRVDRGRSGAPRRPQALSRVLSEELKFDFVIRFRGKYRGHRHDGRRGQRPIALGWRRRSRANLRGAAVTSQAYPGRHRGLAVRAKT